MRLHPGFYGSLIPVLSQIVTFFLVFQEKTFLQELGITDALYYHMNLTADPIPLYYYGNEGGVSKLLGGVEGVGIYPIGAFVNKLYLNDEPRIPAHEGYHYFEQKDLGTVQWLREYYGEMLVSWAYYGGDYWKGPHNVNSREMAARKWAGEKIHEYPVPSPRWQRLWDNFTASVSDLLN